MAEDIAKAAAEVGNKAVMDLSLTAGAFSLSLKIDNVWLAGAVSVIGAFYLACKGPSESAIRRALERKFLGVVDPKVTNIEDGHSILTELLCSTETSFLVFLEDFETKRIKFRLEEEFKKNRLYDRAGCHSQKRGESISASYPNKKQVWETSLVCLFVCLFFSQHSVSYRKSTIKLPGGLIYFKQGDLIETGDLLGKRGRRGGGGYLT